MAVSLAAAALSACGGGTDGTGSPTPDEQITSSGAMVKGSVILNGVHFDEAAATVTDDRGRSAAQLATGMVTKLRGRSDDGATGVADRIDVENEARGVIASIEPNADPQRFRLGGLTVVVDAQTVYANLGGFTDLATGKRVEVHGLRDAAGLLRATRVEAVGAASAVNGLDELRGPIVDVDTAADRFTLNDGIAVHYAGAAFSPNGANETALVVGALVEVRGTLNGSVFTATQVDLENLEDVDFAGKAGEKQEIEGFVSGFTAHPGTFLVDGRSVQTTGDTDFKDGTAADLDNNVKVEVEGTIDAQGRLVATTIKFKQTRVVLQGLVTGADALARTLVVLNQTVSADDLTRIFARPASGPVSDLLSDIVPNTDCVEATGHLRGSEFVAERIRELNSCGADVIQARVLAEDEPNAALTFFGGLRAVVPPTAGFRDANDLPIDRAAFFAAVTAAMGTDPGTLVRVRGAFAGGELAVDEASLEN
jgi:hypothetical protein